MVTPASELAGVVRTRTDPALLKTLALAFRWQKLLDEGRYSSVSELAAAEKTERGYLGKVLQLTLLPPTMVQAIVDWQHGAEVTLLGLLAGFHPLGHDHCRKANDDRSPKDGPAHLSLCATALATYDAMHRRTPAFPFSPYFWLAEASWVYAVHSAQLWANPAEAGARLTSLWTEKQKAFADGSIGAGFAALRGATPSAIAEAAMAPTRRCVRRNAKKIRNG